MESQINTEGLAERERLLTKYEPEMLEICKKYGYKNMVEVFLHDHAQAIMMINEIVDLAIEKRD